jgi:hypothetical protein
MRDSKNEIEMTEKNENIRKLNESEFLSFLYAEKDRLHTNFSKPGWNNWAFGGVFVALVIFLFNILTTPNLCTDWDAVLMLFIGYLSVTIILIIIYPSLLPRMEVYYFNRISNLWDESPIFEFIMSGILFFIISILLIVSNNYSWILYVFGFLSLERLGSVCFLFRKRNHLVYSGTRYNFIPTNRIGLVLRLISFGLFLSIAIYSFCGFIREINQYLNEVQIAAVFLGFSILIYVFFKTNSTTNRMLNGIDNIIDRYAYSNISQQDAMEELMYLRYGSNVKQIVKNDLSLFMSALTGLERINTQLDVIIKTIEEDKLTPQLYYEWLSYYKKERPKLTDANSKGKKLVERLDNINKIPNDIKYSDDFKSLIDLTKSGLEKTGSMREKFRIILDKLVAFKETYYCRKSGSVCLDLECEKRNNKMSIRYALKAFPLKHALYLIIHRKR